MKARVGAVVVVGIVWLVAAVAAGAQAPTGPNKALVKSGAKDPKISGGALERLSSKRVALTVRVRLPDLNLDRETARVQLRVYRDAATQVPGRKTGRSLVIPGNRRAKVRFQIGGKAGKRLARAIAKDGKVKALELVSVKVEHKRDLFAGKRIDHTWVRTARGRELLGRKPGGSGGDYAERGLGGITGSEFKLNVYNGGGEAIRVSSGSLTCASGAGGVNGYAVGGGYGLMVSTNVSEVSSGVVGTNKGFVSSVASASTIPNPEMRTFGYEAALQYSKWGLVPPLFQDLRYAATISALPDREDICSSGTHTFAVAADGASTGNHLAKIYQFSRKSIIDSASEVTAFPDGTLNATGFADSLVDTGHGTWTLSYANTGSAGYPTLSSPCSDAGHWMECKFPPGDPREQSRWVDVTVPGSHDSSTGALGLDVEPSTSGGCSGGPGPVDVLKNFPNVTRNWAVTQPSTLREQLERGIRYLDMRIAYDGSHWRPIHTVYSGDTLVQAQQMIANWAAQHPTELVVVDFNHICLLNGGTAASFLSQLSVPDPVTGKSLCSEGYKIIGPGQPVASDLGSRTVADIRADKGNVLVYLQNKDFDQPSLAECGFAPEGVPDYTKSPAVDTAVVPKYDAWPNQEGPAGSQTPVPVDYGSCAIPADSELRNQQIKDYGYTNGLISGLNLPTISSYKTQSPVPLLQSQMIYTLRFDGAANAIISGDLVSNIKNCPSSLLQWGHALIEGGAPAREPTSWPTGARTPTW